jgi:hypothetical protein
VGRASFGGNRPTALVGVKVADLDATEYRLRQERDACVQNDLLDGDWLVDAKEIYRSLWEAYKNNEGSRTLMLTNYMEYQPSMFWVQTVCIFLVFFYASSEYANNMTMVRFIHSSHEDLSTIFTCVSLVLALLMYWIYPICVIMLSVLVIIESQNEGEAVMNALAMCFLLEVNNIMQFYPGPDSTIWIFKPKSEAERGKILEAGEWARMSFLLGLFSVSYWLILGDPFFTNPHLMLNPTRSVYGPIVFFSLSEATASALDFVADLYSRLRNYYYHKECDSTADLDGDYLGVLLSLEDICKYLTICPCECSNTESNRSKFRSKFRFLKTVTLLLRTTAALLLTGYYLPIAREMDFGKTDDNAQLCRLANGGIIDQTIRSTRAKITEMAGMAIMAAGGLIVFLVAIAVIGMVAGCLFCICNPRQKSKELVENHAAAFREGVQSGSRTEFDLAEARILGTAK